MTSMSSFFAEIVQQAFIDANNMALIEQAYGTADFLEKCSKFMRYANKKQKEILAKDEIKALEIYLDLRKFHDKIECLIDVKTQTAIIGHLELIRIIYENIKFERNSANIDNPYQIQISESTSENCIYVDIKMPTETKAASDVPLRKKVYYK